MATRQEERERLRRHRRERERELRRAETRRVRVLQLIAGAAFVAIATVAVLVTISQGSSGGGDAQLEGTDEALASLAGIPQRGGVLGDPDAKVTIVEFGDLQCPACRDYAEQVIPTVLDDLVRPGRARLEFRNWAILGPDSRRAAAAAYAAREQGRYWQFIDIWYRNQGLEHSGYVTPDFLRAVARAAGVADIARWERERKPSRWSRLLGRTSLQAETHGFTGTPSFVVSGPGGTIPLGTPHSAGEIADAVEGAG